VFGHKGKGYTTHLLVDKRGFPVNVRVTPANESERAQVVPMLKQIKPPKGSELQADKGYDSDPLRHKLRWFLGMTSAIPKRNFSGKVHKDPSKTTRWRVEQSHAHRHASSRRTVVCYDKNMSSFTGFVLLSVIWRLMQLMSY
jgi:transposase